MLHWNLSEKPDVIYDVNSHELDNVYLYQNRKKLSTLMSFEAIACRDVRGRERYILATNIPINIYYRS